MNDRLTEDSLLAANERFYRTFEKLDYPALAALWEESERTFCLHPGWMPLFGPKAVMDSWKRIIENTTEIRFT
ncbi:MAG: nuclear transport factor 2 family protein, partial [bacterium]